MSGSSPVSIASRRTAETPDRAAIGYDAGRYRDAFCGRRQVFQDLHIIDWHAHFPIKGDVSQGGRRTREVRESDNPQARERQAFRQQQIERTRHRWRLAFDFPEPETAERTPEEQ